MSTFLEITSACQTIQDWAAADPSHRVAIISVGEFCNLGLKRIDALAGQQARAIITLAAAAKTVFDTEDPKATITKTVVKE